MKVLVLDGGMGTTLEALGHDVSSPMWGCELVERNPGVVADVHARYVAAGADLIETATYQLTVPALLEVGYDESAAHAVMHAAVELAAAAALPSAAVVLSLGPYGATLRPGQEYAGLYPPPYGPAGSSTPGATNYADTTQLERSISALVEFHLARLRVYATHSSWNHVRWVAFETVPVLSEITAIRRAIAVLQTEGLWGGRRFWISSAFPGGKHGQRTADGTAVQSAEVLRTMLEDGEGCARPDGVGINCTNPQYIPILIADFDAAASTLASATTGTWHAPWLVVYPDGGAVYDVVAQTWTEVQHASPDQWAVELLRATEKVGALDIWAGAIVGGCCKSSFAEIAALRTAVGPK